MGSRSPLLSHIGRNGNAYLAWAFIEAVHHALWVCPQAKRFYDRICAKRNGALATKALAAKWSKGAYHLMKRWDRTWGKKNIRAVHEAVRQIP